MTLKHKTFSAVRWTTSASGARALLQIAQLAVLARLLTPADYGLMAMVSVVLGFAGIFADMGMNGAFVQRANVTEQERSSMFWLNVGMSSVLTLLIVSLSPLLARWFGDARLTPLLMLAASTFVISALGQQVRLSAEKALRFRPVVLVEIAAALLGFAAAVASAYAGWGVYALILGSLVGAVGSTIFTWVFLARGWRPLWRCRLNDVQTYLGFGGALVANNLVNEVNRSIDLLLGGRMLGAAVLGLYSMPRQLVFQIQGMVNPIVTRVGFPLIAQVQADIPRVRAIYLKTLNMTAATNAPLYVGIAFFAPEVVRLLLGDKWLNAIDLMRVLAVWGFLRSTANPVGSLLMGMGRADLSLKWNLAMLCLVPLVLWLCSHYGHMGLAWALLGLQVVLFVPAWYVLVRPLCKAELIEYSVAALRPFVLAAVAIAPGYLLIVEVSNIYARIVIAVVSAATIYLLLSYRLNREWIVAMLQMGGRG